MDTCGINKDRITNSNKRRKVKKVETTTVDGKIVGIVRNFYGRRVYVHVYSDEVAVFGNNEELDGSDDSRAEVPNNEDVVVRAPILMAGTCKNPRRRTCKKKKD